MDRRQTADDAFKNAVLVAAHPDDEILWFSSVIARIPKIVIAFLAAHDPALSLGRQRSLTLHPKRGLVALRLDEADVFGLGGRNPKSVRYGVEVLSRRANAAYRANYDHLVALLRPLLAGSRRVYTHAPWGEYGHPEHVQVHAAVRQLQEELGFQLWFPNYARGPADKLHARLAPSTPVAERVVLPTDLGLAQQIECLYRQHNCWTWYRSYRWPQNEEMLCRERGQAGSSVASQHVPILIGPRLGLGDRLRWKKAAVARRLEHSPAGSLISHFARRSGAQAAL